MAGSGLSATSWRHACSWRPARRVRQPGLDVLAGRAAGVARRQQVDVDRPPLPNGPGVGAPVSEIRQQCDVPQRAAHDCFRSLWAMAVKLTGRVPPCQGIRTPTCNSVAADCTSSSNANNDMTFASDHLGPILRPTVVSAPIGPRVAPQRRHIIRGTGSPGTPAEKDTHSPAHSSRAGLVGVTRSAATSRRRRGARPACVVGDARRRPRQAAYLTLSRDLSPCFATGSGRDATIPARKELPLPCPCPGEPRRPWPGAPVAGPRCGPNPRPGLTGSRCRSRTRRNHRSGGRNGVDDRSRTGPAAGCPR